MSSQPSAFLETLIAFLLPYFSAFAEDTNAARSDVIETLASYATRTRAEMLHAAQIIAFGMSSLDTLAEANATEMSPSMRLRYRGCANGLNRSCKQQEDALNRRLARDLPEPQQPEPVSDLSDAETRDMIEAAQTAIASYRSRLPSDATAGLRQTPEWRNMQLSTDAMLNSLKQISTPS